MLLQGSFCLHRMLMFGCTKMKQCIMCRQNNYILSLSTVSNKTHHPKCYTIMDKRFSACGLAAPPGIAQSAAPESVTTILVEVPKIKFRKKSIRIFSCDLSPVWKSQPVSPLTASHQASAQRAVRLSLWAAVVAVGGTPLQKPNAVLNVRHDRPPEQNK